MSRRKAVRKKARTLNEKLQPRRPLNRARVDAISAKLRALPVVDDRSPEEVLGYDEIGIPT